MEGNLSHRCTFLTHVLPWLAASLWGEEAPPRQVQEATYTDLQKTYANNMLTGWRYTYQPTMVVNILLIMVNDDG